MEELEWIDGISDKRRDLWRLVPRSRQHLHVSGERRQKDDEDHRCLPGANGGYLV